MYTGLGGLTLHAIVSSRGVIYDVWLFHYGANAGTSGESIYSSEQLSVLLICGIFFI